MTGLSSGLVSFLMSDIARSTELVRQLGRERYEDVLREHRGIIAAAVEELGGHVVDVQADSTFAVFARASDAVRAAARAQLALEARDGQKRGVDGLEAKAAARLDRKQKHDVADGVED